MDTRYLQNCRLQKGPSTFKKISYIFMLYTKNGRENVISTSIDNSLYEIMPISQECSVDSNSAVSL